MTDLPILFSAPMVKALLDGRKTQTRRVIKPQPIVNDGGSWRWDGRNGAFVGASGTHFELGFPRTAARHSRIQTGDRLWVREAWSGIHAFRDTPPAQRESVATPDGPLLRDDIWYWADGSPTGGDYERPRPSLHMPRWASRITLIVEGVKVERLMDISEADAIAEGVDTERCCGVPSDSCGTHLGGCCGQPEAVDPVKAYQALWNEINGPGAWEENPWVVAYTFRPILGNIDQLGRAAA